MSDPVTPCVRCAGEADSSDWEDSAGDPICNPCGRRIVDNHAASSATERAARVAAESERDYAIQEASKAREELWKTRQGFEAYIGAHDMRVEERDHERAARLAAEGALERLRWGVVANAGRLSSDSHPRWAHVMDAVGCGSTSAHELCIAAGFDPDEKRGGDDDDEPLDSPDAGAKGEVR